MNIKQVRDKIRGLGGPGSGQKGHTTPHDKAVADHAAAVTAHEEFVKGKNVFKTKTVTGADGTVYTHEKGHLHPMADSISDDEADTLERKPDASVQTGNSDGTAASELSIYYHKGNTIVSAGGEAYNTEPWKHPGKVSPEDVLNEYHRAWPASERKKTFGAHDYSQNKT